MRLSLKGALYVSTALTVVFSSVLEALGASAGEVAEAAVVTDVVLPFTFVVVSPLVAAAMLLLSVAGPDLSSTAVSEAGCG